MQEFGLRVDALFQAWTQPGAPGAALAVVRNGETVLDRCYGLANLEHDVPIDRHTRFHIASVTKTFCAAALVLLDHRGQLSLEDEAKKHVPELPFEGGITIRRMLGMTSGLRESMELMRLCGVFYRHPRTTGDLLELAYNQRHLSFPSGERFIYTNTGFILCSLIVERVTGQPFEDFLQDNLFDPLGMTDTTLRDDDTSMVPRLAFPYVPLGEGGYARGGWAFGIAGGGAGVSTTANLAKWLGMFRAGGLDGARIVARMAEPGTLIDGSQTHYGLGLQVRRYRGVKVLGHGGSFPGYKAFLAYVPERDFGFAFLSNREDADTGRITQQLLDLGLEGELPEPPVGDARSVASLNAWEGRYVDRAAGEVLNLKVDGGALKAEKMGVDLTLRPEQDGRFADRWALMPVTLSVEEGEAGKPRLAVNFGGHRGTYDPAPELSPASHELAVFAGQYASQELDTSLEVLLKDGRLMVRYGPRFHETATLPLEPVAADIFLARSQRPGWKFHHAHRFLRNDGGNVTATVVSSDRVKDVRFERV